MSLSLTELRDQLSALLYLQSPHLPTNVTEIKLTDGYRTVELHGINQGEINDLKEDLIDLRAERNDLEEEVGELEVEVRDLNKDIRSREREVEVIAEERDAARSEAIRLQADLIELGLQLNAVLSR